MKKYFLSLGLIITFGIYTALYKLEGNVEGLSVSSNSSLDPTRTPSDNQNSQDSSMNMGPMMGHSMMGSYKDGSFTGDVTDAYYGYVQVKVTISNGQISNVDFLQYPNDRRTSIFINSQAMPYLKQEAIQAQSANVNIVSGATATSQAFIESLSSALDKAKA